MLDRKSYLSLVSNLKGFQRQFRYPQIKRFNTYIKTWRDATRCSWNSTYVSVLSFRNAGTNYYYYIIYICAIFYRNLKCNNTAFRYVRKLSHWFFIRELRIVDCSIYPAAWQCSLQIRSSFFDVRMYYNIFKLKGTKHNKS